jgi:hypothetical protein
MLDTTGKRFDQFQRAQNHVVQQTAPEELFLLFPSNIQEKYTELKGILSSMDLNNLKSLFGMSSLLLNHGSYGALPKVIRELQQEWTREFVHHLNKGQQPSKIYVKTSRFYCISNY